MTITEDSKITNIPDVVVQNDTSVPETAKNKTDWGGIATATLGALTALWTPHTSQATTTPSLANSAARINSNPEETGMSPTMLYSLIGVGILILILILVFVFKKK